MSDKTKSDKLLKEWQNRLGLQDWDIVMLTNCKPEEMAMADSTGCTTYTEVIKCARIEIVDPQYYGERIRPFDFEETLVHELLHLKLCLIGDNVPDLQERIVHQLIDDFARAFVDAKNSKQKS